MTEAIVALTPNLALDRTLTLGRRLEPGRMHRVRAVREAAGGKGVNLARAVRALGGEVCVAGVVGGHNGRKLRELLGREGLSAVLEEVDGESRECAIVLDAGPHPTEINEPGPAVDAATWTRLLSRLPAGRVAVSGSLPPGLEGEGFARLLARLPGGVVVDTSGAPLAAALEAGAELIAPNEREILDLADRLGAPGGQDPLRCARWLRERYPARILLSRGAAGAALVADRVWSAAAPEVDADNPVGSGDCLLGAFLWAEAAGRGPGDALRLGVAAGADNARRGGGGTLDPAGIEELAARVRVTEAAA